MHKKIKALILLIVILFCENTFSQDKPVQLNFNVVNYFAPATNYSKSIDKTSYEITEVIIDFNKNSIIIKINYSDGEIESEYKIKKISELQNSPSKGNYYTFTCSATNYADVIIEVSKQSDWLTRYIPHNGIIHKFYIR